AEEARVTAFLDVALSLCAVNSHTSCVDGGTEQAIDAVAARRAGAGPGCYTHNRAHATPNLIAYAGLGW
ncbi:hypothetical protein AAHH80_41395, partial [Burkholderia pseudomallei]